MERKESLISFPVEAGEKTIFLKLEKHNKQHLWYRLSSTMPMHTLLLDYCFRTGLVYKNTKFSYNNSRVLESHTPDSLKMGANRDHVILVFSSREDMYVDLQCRRPLKDGFMFLTVKPFGNGGDEDEDACHYYNYKYNRCGCCMPLLRLMDDYCVRRRFKKRNVCFFYRSDSSREDIITSNSTQGVETTTQKEIHDVIHVFPAAPKDRSCKPDKLRMNDYDDLSALYFDMGDTPEAVVEYRDDDCCSWQTVTVMAIDGKRCYYKIRRDTPLCWILLHHCDRVGLSHYQMKFTAAPRGVPITLEDAISETPNKLKMENHYYIVAAPLFRGP